MSFLGSVVRTRVRLRESVISLDTFNDPGAPPPGLGASVLVSFEREDLLMLERSNAT